MLINQKFPFHIKKTTKINSTLKQLDSSPRKRVFSLQKLSKPTEANILSKINTHFIEGKQEIKEIKEVTENQANKYFLNEINQSELILTQVKRSYSNKKLSPIKQYETKLRISSESWLVFDFRKDSYKRGWRPADVGEFSGLTRLLLLRVFIQLLKSNSDLQDFELRVNTQYLKQEVEMARQQKLQPSKRKGYIYREPISRIFQNNIIIKITDLFYGLLMTNYDDILEYAIVFMGYLCYCHITGTRITEDDSSCHYIEKVSEACTYAQYLSQYLRQNFFPAMEMTTSDFDAQNYIFWSCANDICRLYLSLQENQYFKSIIKCKQYVAKAKHQVGFKYWEKKIIKFRNKRIDMGQNYEFVGSWRGKRNFGVVCKNSTLDILIVLEDCKFGMTQCDIRNIEEWVKALMKPIVDMRKTHAKLLPLLRVSSQSPPKFSKLLKRSTTDLEDQN